MLKTKKYYGEQMRILLEEQPFLNQTDLAYELLLQEILNGELVSGEKVPQEQLAELFNMSRTPVRDALIRLEEDRFLKRGPKGGYQVSRVRLKDYMDFSEFRILLESKAAYLAARCITLEQMEALTQNLKQFHQAAKQQELHRILRLDKEFHDIVARASGNYYVYEALERYRSRELLHLQMSLHKESIAFVLDKHQAIYDAISRHDEEAAEKAMVSHLKFYIKNVCYLYD